MPRHQEPFAERIRRLREEKNWSQNELAERADLAPAALSRILSGEREPRMEHIIALASALEVTLTELVADTSAARVILDWVPRARFEEAEQSRIEAVRERDVARTDAAARVAEVESLKKTLGDVSKAVENLENQLSQCQAEIDAARKQRRELAQLREQVATLDAERRRLEAQAALLNQGLEASRAEAGEYFRRWEEAYARTKQLQADVSSAKGGALVTGALGLFLGAVLNSDPPRRRRS